MSDNVTELKIKNRETRQLPVKKIVILCVVAVAVLCLLSLILFHDELNLDAVKRWGRYMAVRNDEEYGSYSYDSNSSNCYENFDDGLAVASIGGLNVYRESGEEVHQIQRQIELPRLLVQGDMALVYDVGGHGLVALHKKDGEVLQLEETHPILDADLSENGSVCISSSTGGYKSVLSVYNNEQELIYRWLSSSVYYPLCAIAPDGEELAAVAVGQVDGEFESSICLFHTDSEQIEQQITLGTELIYDLVYLDGDTLCAVGENSVQFVTTDGKTLGTYSYNGNYLKDFDFGGNGFLTLTTNMYRAGNRYSLMTVDDEGREIANAYIGEEILDISASGRYVAVLMQGTLRIYTQHLSVYHETTDVSNVTDVVMRDDGTVLLMGGGQGRLYIP